MKDVDQELKRAMSEAGSAFDPVFSILEELVFDDEPLEAVLYGTGDPTPTAASIYAWARQLMQQTEKEAGGPDPRITLALATQLMDASRPIPRDVYGQLLQILQELRLDGRRLVSHYPDPPRLDCPPEMRSLADWLRRTTEPFKDEDLHRAVDLFLYGIGLAPATQGLVAESSLRTPARTVGSLASRTRVSPKWI
jgi:hypothetical protein